MPTFVSLVRLTEEGLRKRAESPARFAEFERMCERLGVSVKAMYYTLGPFDAVTVFEGTEEAMAAVVMAGSRAGTAHAQVMRAFTVEETQALAARVAQAG